MHTAIYNILYMAVCMHVMKYISMIYTSVTIVNRGALNVCYLQYQCLVGARNLFVLTENYEKIKIGVTFS